MENDEELTNDDIRSHIFNTVKDLIANFLYYDRKGDEDLTLSVMKKAILEKIVTQKEIVDLFEKELREKIKENYHE